MMYVLVALGWLVCGVIGYGMYLGRFTHKYPDQKHDDWQVKFIHVVLGPGAIIGGLLFCVMVGEMPRHFRLRAFTTEQRWKIFQQKYPSLGRGYFDKEHAA